jgi:hypothetical protein
MDTSGANNIFKRVTATFTDKKMMKKNKRLVTQSIQQGTAFMKKLRDELPTIGVSGGKNIEGYEGGAANPISLDQVSTLKHYGSFIRYNDGGGNTKYYVNRYGIMRPVESGTQLHESCSGLPEESIEKADFDMLVLNNQLGIETPAMTEGDACGNDGKYTVLGDTGRVGWYDAHTGVLGKLPTTIPTSCGTTGEPDGVNTMSDGPGEIGGLATHTECSFPVRVGTMAASEWDAAVSSTASSSGRFETIRRQYDRAKRKYDRFLESKSLFSATVFDETVSHYYGKNVYVVPDSDLDSATSGTSILPSAATADTYYVTRYGFARKWSSTAWASSDLDTCRRPISDGTDLSRAVAIRQTQFDKLPTGEPMEPNERCGLAGTLVTNGTDVAWIDIKNIRHNILGGRGARSCREFDKITITDEQFNAMPEGDEYSWRDGCTVSGMSSTDFNKFRRLWDNVYRAGEALKGESARINENTNTLNESKITGDAEISVAMNELLANHNKLLTHQTRQVEATGGTVSATERLTYTFRMYIVMILVTVLITTITIHTAVSGTNTVFAYGTLAAVVVAVLFVGIMKAIRR